MVEIAGNLKSDRLICTVPKGIPICVSELLATQGWVTSTILHVSFDFQVFSLRKYEKGSNVTFFRPTVFLAPRALSSDSPISMKFWGLTSKPYRIINF